MKNTFTSPRLTQPIGSRAKAPKIYLGLVFWLLFSLLASCAQATPATPGTVYREETVTLPTSGPTLEPTPLNTRVIPLEALTPSPTPTITPLPDEVRALVVDILDGDTITVVMDGDPPGQTYTVRYLGIDAPPNTPSVPWGVAAFEVNRELTNGQVVRLERDQSDVDDEGNLLRYVFLDDALLSITLTEQGLARANITEPDTRFQAEILEAEGRAKAGQLGLWGNRPPIPTPRPVASPTTAITGTATLTVTVVTPETIEPETQPTVELEATVEATPASSPSPTTEPETTATVESEAETPTNTTPEPTSESTPTGNSDGEDLQGPQ
jgi:endonuclease YncB( thermonuclease family)